MADENIKMKWNGQIGPAFVAILGQIVFGAIAVTMIYAQLTNGVANTKEAADKLTQIVARQTEIQNSFGNRLTKVETTLGDLQGSVIDIKTSVGRLNDKFDTNFAPAK